MATIKSSAFLGRLADSAFVRVIAYYVLLFAATALFVELVPGADGLVFGGIQPSPELDAGVRGVITGTGEQVPIFSAPPGLPISEVFAMAAAFALMLPVAWIYIMTRQRKGFRQSVVQTLVILPIVVAGVVFMVKNSLALAFSLGGIVAAVSFRNTLRDTKDAVYIFLATGVGLAAGIQSVPFAAALSITYNIVILILWYTDFGRSPADLQGPPAARRLERALALSNRTSAFVSLVDDQILKSLTPDQLDALSERTHTRGSRRRAEEAGRAPQSRPPHPGRDRSRAAGSRSGPRGLHQALGVPARRAGRGRRAASALSGQAQEEHPGGQSDPESPCGSRGPRDGRGAG